MLLKRLMLNLRSKRDGGSQRSPIFSKKFLEALDAYLMLLPFFVIFGIFAVYSFFYAFYISFHKFNLLSPPVFVGLSNYIKLFKDQDYIGYAIPNTIKYTIIVVSIQTFLSLVLAFILDQNIKFRSFFRTIYYLPSVTSSVVISLIFIWLFSKVGAINSIFGLDIDWLNNPKTALWTISLVNIWSTTGTMILIFLAGLQDIPTSVYESASIDGANRWDIFWKITLPLLRPVILFVVVMGTIGCFQVFDQIYLMTRGGPLNSTLTMAYYVYDKAFGRGLEPQMGIASAAAFILGIVIFIFTLVQRHLLEGRE